MARVAVISCYPSTVISRVLLSVVLVFGKLTLCLLASFIVVLPYPVAATSHFIGAGSSTRSTKDGFGGWSPIFCTYPARQGRDSRVSSAFCGEMPLFNMALGWAHLGCVPFSRHQRQHHQTPTTGKVHPCVWTAACPGANFHYSQLSPKFQISLPLPSFPAAVLTAFLPHWDWQTSFCQEQWMLGWKSCIRKE